MAYLQLPRLPDGRKTTRRYLADGTTVMSSLITARPCGWIVDLRVSTPPGNRQPVAMPGTSGLLTLAHLRCGDTNGRLAAAFDVGITTIHRYIREAVDVLAALAPTLAQAVSTAARKAFVILDGQGLPSGRRYCPLPSPRPLGQALHRPARRQRLPSQDPYTLRTGHGHLQDLAPPTQTLLQHHPRRPSRTHPPHRRIALSDAKRRGLCPGKAVERSCLSGA